MCKTNVSFIILFCSGTPVLFFSGNIFYCFFVCLFLFMEPLFLMMWHGLVTVGMFVLFKVVLFISVFSPFPLSRTVSSLPSFIWHRPEAGGNLLIVLGGMFLSFMPCPISLFVLFGLVLTCSLLMVAKASFWALSLLLKKILICLKLCKWKCSYYSIFNMF